MNPDRSTRARLCTNVQWALFVALTFVAALYLSWQGLAQANFLYPLWYEWIGIEENIAVYGPENRHRNDFESTTRAERLRLFGGIVDAVHAGGEGLEALVYYSPRGDPIAPLLTKAEIVHLEDVARLIDRLRPVGLGALVLWPLALAALRAQGLVLPSIPRLLLAALALVGLMVIALLWIGPVKVFYALHEWVFPPGHDWFFYYQDSLMSTMMKAPDLFGAIAATLLVASLALASLLLYTARRLLYW